LYKHYAYIKTSSSHSTIQHLQALIKNWNYQQNLSNASIVVTEPNYHVRPCHFRKSNSSTFKDLQTQTWLSRTMSVFKNFPGLENLEKNSRTFKDLQEPCRWYCV